MKPYMCPICHGKGIVPNDFYILYPYLGTADASPVQCESCHGSGIIYGKEVDV